MSDPHFELSAHPSLEYYRKQAKHLQHTYEAGDAAARARVADMLGDRAAERFLLSDAQFVLAQEHGFRTWAEFRTDIQSRSATEDRPVSRLMGIGPCSYASLADALLTDLRRNDPGELQRLRAYVPRHAAATDASAAELRDARLIIARELGFPTWRELMSATEKSMRDLAERQEERRRLRPQAAFRPRSRRPTIRGRSSPRRSSTPASTAGPRSCAGSSTSASAPTSRPTAGGPACTGRSRTLISR